MATNTTNYNLTKPAQDDFYNVDDFNNNADIIDTQMKANADKADAALPASDFTGANVLTKLAADNSVVPVKNGGTGASSSSSALSNLGGLSKSGGTMTGDLTIGANRVKYNSASNTYIDLWENDSEGLTKTNNVDIGSWQGVSFSNTCSTGSVSKGSPAVSIGTRNGNIYLAGDIFNSDGENYVQSLLTGGEISVIKSIQRGTVNLEDEQYSATATISAVDTSKAVIHFLGGVYGADTLQSFGRIELTNSTTVSVYRYERNYTAAVGFEVIEYH
ncbi:MAG: hypothetical protein LKJ25_04270 [Clostridia bacterium]|jgi:hypothetical protein|nr:hypothetical protein [Clostridia bacterium]